MMQTNPGSKKMSNRTFNKPKNKKYTIKRLLTYMLQFKGWFLLALFLTIASNTFTLIGPYLSGKALNLIDSGPGNIPLNDVMKIALMMFVFYVASCIISFILSFLMIKISKKIIHQLRVDAFGKLIKLPIAYFDNNATGDIISKLSYDIDTVNASLSSDLIQICTSIIVVIGSFAMMVITSPLLVIIFVVTLPLSLFFTRFMLKRTHKLFKKRSSTLGELNGYVEEMITGSKTIKAYGIENKIIASFDNINEKASDAAYKAEYYGAFTGPGVNFVNNLSLSLICIFGSILYLYVPTFKLGTISSFILYSKKFAGPINEIANIFVDIQSSLAAAERVFSIIDEKPEALDNAEAITINDVEGRVTFDNVSFSYNGTKKIINNLSFSVKPGSVTAIVGKTGAGKTTIVNLLMRFYDISSGDIKIDDNSIYNIKRKDFRKSFAMVLQETWLFEGTVYDNICYGAPHASKEEVIAAAKAANIHNFIMRLPKGYDTIISEDGENISKGQKQLLTIARMMLIDAKMLILDEATSNVDTRTELKIQTAMTALMKQKTCFVIAHRLSTIVNADEILVVNDGDIVEKGTHKELMNKKGYYYELYTSQYQ